MTDMLHDLRPRFIVHATPTTASTRTRGDGNIGVYDRLHCWQEVAVFAGNKYGSRDRAERLADELNATPPTCTVVEPRPVCIVDALNARLA